MTDSFVIQSPFLIGNLELPHRLIQGPLAGFSCAPMRELFSHFHLPAYAVTEMISAKDILHKHQPSSRYLYKSQQEGLLAYQLSGNNAQELSLAAKKCEDMGADLIDLNCGCPKDKIRKKGAGSALLENPHHLQNIIVSIKETIQIPLTIKIRLQSEDNNKELIKIITESGADAIIIHGRTPFEDYSVPCNYQIIKELKPLTHLPIIANGDIQDLDSLHEAITHSDADGYMIARAGCGQPWLFQHLLSPKKNTIISIQQRTELFIMHLEGLAKLENEFKALLQARSLIKYYFRPYREQIDFKCFYKLQRINELQQYLNYFCLGK